jgi:hypothetical protein
MGSQWLVLGQKRHVPFAGGRVQEAVGRIPGKAGGR